MSYSSGTAASVDALMLAVVTFAVANAGMTVAVSRTETINAESCSVRCLSKGGKYWWLAWSTTQAYGKPSDASTGSTWDTLTSQPPSAYRAQWNPLAAPFLAYHLFTEGTVVWASAQQTNGAWTHLCFGEVTKFGTWTGGQFVNMTCLTWAYDNFPGLTGMTTPQISSFGACAGMNVSQATGSTGYNNGGSFMYAPKNGADFATAQRDEGSVTSPVLNKLIYIGGAHDTMHQADRFQRASLNSFNGRAPALEMVVAMRDPTSDLYEPMGRIPNVRFINMTHFNAGDTVNTDWMVFPVNKFGEGGVYLQYQASGIWGWAIKK